MDTTVETQEIVTNPEIVQFEQKKKNKTGVPAYTKAEDRLILDEVMKYPDNIAHGCNLASKKLKNRKPSSVQSRYYYLVRKDSKMSVVMTGSAAGFANSKTNPRKGGILTRKEPLKPIAVMIKQLLELHPEERQKIKDFLTLIE